MQPEIKILIAVLSQMNEGDMYKRHEHPYYQLDHIIRGRVEFTIEGSTYTAGVGDTVLIPKNYVHSLIAVAKETSYYLEIKFSSFSKGVMEMCSDIGNLVKHDDFSGRIFKEIFDEQNNSTQESEEIMITYLYAILFHLSAKKRHEKSTPSKYIEVSAYSAPVRNTIRFLEDNYKNRLSLDDIAAQMKLTKSYLCGLFKRETTVTVFECLMIVRVRKAVELLTYTNMSLAQISEETGFVSITHFNRIFTKHVMIPPGQYRKRLKFQSSYWIDATAGKKADLITAAALEGKKIDFPQFTLNLS